MKTVEWRFPKSQQASISLHHCETEFSELIGDHVGSHVTYDEIVELDICRDVHQVSVDLDVCLAISKRCR